jgi:phage gp36-like protein
MAYCTAEDIAELYGETARVVMRSDADRAQLDVVRATRAIASADAEIDSYLVGRYSVPVTPTPALLKQLSIDIALYRMALTMPHRSDEMRQRYEDALKTLDKLAAEKIDLVIDGDGDGDEDETPVGTTVGVLRAVRG